MKNMSLWKTTLVLLGTLGTLVPQQLVLAGDVSAAPAAKQTKQTKDAILDVTLDKAGSLTGYVVDAQGKPQANEVVRVMQGRTEVAKATTNAKGQFEVKGLRGGMYGIVSAKGTTGYRVWTSNAAPKTAKQFAVVVKDTQLVRAQDDEDNLLSTPHLILGGAAITGIVLGGVALSRANSADSDAAAAQQQNAALQAQIAMQQQQIDQLQASLAAP